VVMVTVELQGLAETIARWVDPVPGIDAIYLFGSRVRGDHRPDSDVGSAYSRKTCATTSLQFNGSSIRTRHCPLGSTPSFPARWGCIATHLMTLIVTFARGGASSSSGKSCACVRAAS